MNEAQKQQAESLFLNTNKTQTQIAAELGISPRTLYRWIQQGRWQQLRSATRRMPSVLVENIYLQLDDINYSIAQRDRGQRHPTKDESLTISRLMNSIGKVKKETSEGQNIEFLMNLINYVQPKNDDLAKTLTEYGSAFLKDTNPKGFHPYDIEYEEIPPLTANSPAHSAGGDVPETTNVVSELGDVGTMSNALQPNENPAQLEIPFPNQNSCNNTSLSLGEGRAEALLAQDNTSLSGACPATSGREGRAEALLAQDNTSPSLGEGRGEVSPSPIGHNSDIPQPPKTHHNHLKINHKSQQATPPKCPKIIFPGIGHSKKPLPCF